MLRRNLVDLWHIYIYIYVYIYIALLALWRRILVRMKLERACRLFLEALSRGSF